MLQLTCHKMRSSIYAIVVAASLLAVSIPSRNVFVSAQNVAGKMSVKIAPDGHGGGNKSSLSSRRRRRPFWKRRTIDAEDASCDGESSPAWETTRRFIERLKKMERGMGTLILSTLSLLVVYVSSWKNRRKSNESIGITQDNVVQGERGFSSNSVNRMMPLPTALTHPLLTQKRRSSFATRRKSCTRGPSSPLR